MCRYCQRVLSILSMIVPLYNTRTELSPPQTRGFLVGLTQQRLGIGVIVSNWVRIVSVPLTVNHP
ncbi:hypothetical protein C8R41DRAFT_857902 [Lentinula lateritia]|uniref:Uncharacterized protein n=1 Tax=Lentinula lateritia TaxID=40482 RepID=A0ABQ8UZG5_9AGAR|nr:hypothetical protein C8R41DRAFT_857902 [Lentinula lateritia]